MSPTKYECVYIDLLVEVEGIGWNWGYERRL